MAKPQPTGSGSKAQEHDLPYIEAFGRHYHPSGRIFLAFDEDEQHRMDLQHRLFRLCLDGDLSASRLPLTVKHILDLGTGTGVWPIEIAARYPEAQIIGIDASPIQRKTGVPPNVRFEISDIEDPWPCPPNSLDFIHARSIAGGVKDWPKLINQAYEKLKPGGIFELSELTIRILDFDGDFGKVELCPSFLTLYRECAEKVGIDFDPSQTAVEWLDDAGFDKMTQRREILPLGHWAQDDKLKGRQTLINEILSNHFINNCALLFATCGWTKEEFDAVSPEFWTSMKDKRPYLSP
ncbi:S-adenosyl-L-methionine-dependent methyltransferase [Xylariomycetidae sp. FL2044]|nr:S-adenosyl-L-methionine-dependent methyltransferase [Xylariomycetidae sp. FL2044]